MTFSFKSLLLFNPIRSDFLLCLPYTRDVSKIAYGYCFWKLKQETKEF